ncbi:aspartate-semialdehyde dehydrogenase [Candidatus Aerophobetes bacterium]|uniref:Aspartate-semialdehyde dehydrogenase n=1 Tax=Aerophobetes bacterium TaxID=2030807 RepID=A0A2A4YI85_UNCAE|nr:MAG: aspartate-semialdehyde dehydrogenase [Candidatus Aerophobetes bacterium]
MATIGIVGATGLVGEELLKIINYSQIPFEKIFLFNSQKKLCDPILLKGKWHPITAVSLETLELCDVVFFLAGSEISKDYIPHLQRPTVIDLSSAFRTHKAVPLIIPEINGHLLETRPRVIASPNCTTSIMLMALYPLHKRYKLKRICASTYQAASGGGRKLLGSLLEETKRYALKRSASLSSLSYAFNLYPHPASIENCQDNLEETKMIFETRKILEDPTLSISCQCIRVPTLRVHGISLHVDFEDPLTEEEAFKELRAFPGIEIYAQPKMQLSSHEAIENQKILCSRIRIDPVDPTRLSLWVVGDQLLKGAALNAFQILEYLIGSSLILI